MHLITGHFIRSLLVLMLNDIEGKTTMKKKYERRNGGNTLSTHCCIQIRKYFFSVIVQKEFLGLPLYFYLNHL